MGAAVERFFFNHAIRFEFVLQALFPVSSSLHPSFPSLPLLSFAFPLFFLPRRVLVVSDPNKEDYIFSGLRAIQIWSSIYVSCALTAQIHTEPSTQQLFHNHCVCVLCACVCGRLGARVIAYSQQYCTELLMCSSCREDRHLSGPVRTCVCVCPYDVYKPLIVY